ncbi:MAG: 30S ribosome-binding factor RbfA [Gammaproteobacteria bacterium]|jgi:ribosome-binding factor A|nr:30S ribosome-binding factor RbfA [Gammaproteobacteria bacterium]
MPKEFSRSQRLAEQLRRELAEIVRDEIKDPRLGFVSFTEARMSRDLSHAIIYCSVFHAEGNSPEKQKESVEVLNHAVGFIRKAVAHRIRARIVPTLKFVLDDSISRGEAMDELINQAIKSDKEHDANGH